MTRSSVKFFREFYEPVLLRAESKKLRRNLQLREASQKARGKGGFDTRTKEEVVANARKAGAARRKTLTPEVRSYLAALMTDARKRIPPDIRQRSASIASKVRWSRRTPEERKAHSELMLHKRRGKKMADWTAVWPFP